MQQYKLKRGFKPDIERIYSVMQECFPTEISRNGKFLETAYGAMSNIKVWIENKMLCVETVSDKTSNQMTMLSCRPIRPSEISSSRLPDIRQKSA